MKANCDPHHTSEDPSRARDEEQEESKLRNDLEGITPFKFPDSPMDVEDAPPPESARHGEVVCDCDPAIKPVQEVPPVRRRLFVPSND
jgi:hypothetical protein